MSLLCAESPALENSELREPDTRDYLATMASEIGDSLTVVRERVARVVPLVGREVRLLWESGVEETIDIGPLLVRHRRTSVASSESLFQTVSPGVDGRSIVWADGSEIGISWLQDLALTRMSNREFRDALIRLGWTAEEAAAHLGVSRRKIAGYRLEREVPRSIVMSLRFMLLRRARTD